MTVALRLTAALVGALTLGACREQAEQAPPVRPVRTVVVQHTTDSDPITLTGQIQSRDQVNLAFRIDGRLVERSVSVGSVVAAGASVARLQEDDAQNALRTARANLSAAQASLSQAQSDEARQKALLAKEIIAKARYEQAQQALQAAEAQVESAEAQLQSAEDRLGYTVLTADSSGTVVATGAEAGEVVRAGQMVVQLAREGGKDAVFNVPAQLIRNAPEDPLVTVALADDPSITATGHVREVAPQADVTTGTYVVKVALSEPPQSMRLGATIVGSVSLSSEPVVRLPGTALTDVEGSSAVWVVDPAASTVSPRKVSVLRYDSDAVIIAEGLADGEIVVTAGVHALRPGQEVRLLDRSS
ncbi:MAG: efflux RND transporter periplasmic adaptor subunit [Propylenella sp.]